jgi:hypothetical protein
LPFKFNLQRYNETWDEAADDEDEDEVGLYKLKSVDDP